MIDKINSYFNGIEDFDYRKNQLSPDQKEAVEQILYNYDPEQMSQKKYAEMFNEIKGIGVKANPELRRMLGDFGFQTQNITRNDSINSNSRKTITPDQVLEFAEKFSGGRATKNDVDKMIQLLQNYNRGALGNFIDSNM